MESSPLTVTVLSREPPPPWLPIQQRKGRTWRPSSNVAGSPRPRRWRRGRRRKKRSGSCNVESLVFIHGSILVDIAGTPHPNKFEGTTNYKIWLIYLNTMSLPTCYKLNHKNCPHKGKIPQQYRPKTIFYSFNAGKWFYFWEFYFEGDNKKLRSIRKKQKRKDLRENFQ